MNTKGTPQNLRPPWQKGESGNPGGKPVGARNRINAKFLEGLETAFDEGGIEAIRRCRDEEPSTFVRAMVSLLPKEVQVEGGALDHIDDETLERLLGVCRLLTTYSEAEVEAMVGIYEASRETRDAQH
jgi:hypothetical protein